MKVYVYAHPESQVLVISGPDAADFLNRLSTQNFKNFSENDVKYGAFLNGKAQLISLFTAWKTQGSFYLFLEADQFENGARYLDQMHFAENLKIEKQQREIFEIRGVENKAALTAFHWGLPGFFVFSKQDIPAQAELLSLLQFDSLRAFYAYPKFGEDMTQESLLLEGPFESFVDRDKGCYPGQEVIEKIYTYGRLPKKIFKISAGSGKVLKAPEEILVEGQNVGTLTSFYHWQNQPFGLATLKKHFSDRHDAVEIQGQSLQIVKTL